MNRQLSALWDELELGGECPMPDAAAVKRRVNAALNADPSERKLYMRQKIRFAAVLAAAVVALAGTALAVGSNWDAVMKALGAYAPYAHEVTGVSVTDRGIKVTVEAVLADEGRTVAYVSAADLAGDRLDENTTLNGRFAAKCVSYDPNSRTALFAVTVREGSYNEDGSITLNIGSIQPGTQDLYGLGFPQELLADRTLDTQVLKSGEFERNGQQNDDPAVALLPGQTPAPLEGTGLIWVSSAGFDGSGVFHILYEVAEGADCYQWPFFQTIEFDDRESPTTFYSTEIRFGGGKYIDVSYPAWTGAFGNDQPALITRENVSHLTLTGAQCILYTRPEIEGGWSLTFSPDALPQRTLAVEDTLSGMHLKTWTLSPMTVRLTLNGGGTPAFYPLSLYLADGTVVSIPGHGLIEMKEPADNADGKRRYDFVVTWALDAPIDPEQVTGISLGYRMYPVSGDSIGPASWLDKLPE